MKIGIDLGIFKGIFKGENLRENSFVRQSLTALTIKGEPDEPSHPYCKPLKSLRLELLSYEIFLELINKTDWLLRKLVGSLEQKLIAEKRGYEIAKNRVREKLNWRR